MTDSAAPIPGLEDAPRVVSTATSVTGAADRLERPLRYGERLVAVVELTVTGVGLKSTGDGPQAKRELKVVDLYELVGDTAAQTVAALRAQRRMAEDDAAGRAPLPGLEMPADGGVVLTPTEAGAASSAEDDADEGLDLSEPWPGYADSKVADVTEALANTRDAAGGYTPGVVALARRVEAYERGPGKARSGVLNYVAVMLDEAERAANPPAPGEIPPLPGEDDDAGDELTIDEGDGDTADDIESAFEDLE